jgi:GMP synthase-like glutamine amidotransferase
LEVPPVTRNDRDVAVRSNFEKGDYLNAVAKAKEYIAAGDIFQVVLAQRFEVDLPTSAFEIYRALRVVNPSPYMYFLKMPETTIVGSSPEMLVRVRDREIEYRPIAGTLPRGASPSEDEANAEKLKNDEKERAEHIMLVDLGRNDLGRVSQYGTVRVEELMFLEKYSHVMHLVSSLRGELRKDVDRWDSLMACFPAGTVSGAPKVRAMEIIDELEPTKRGVYAGAVLYVGLQQQPRLLHRDSHARRSRQQGLYPGRRRDRRGFRSRKRVHGNGQQVASANSSHQPGTARVRTMILVIDNYDSFTYNLVQYLGELGEDLRVFRNDKITVSDIEAMQPSRIVISPGPGTPVDAGITEDVIRHFHKTTPILGVCLGHQAIGEVFGGKIVPRSHAYAWQGQRNLSRHQRALQRLASRISRDTLSLAHGFERSGSPGNYRRNERRNRHGLASSGISYRRHSVSLRVHHDRGRKEHSQEFPRQRLRIPANRFKSRESPPWTRRGGRDIKKMARSLL